MKQFDQKCRLCEVPTEGDPGAFNGHLYGIFPITFCEMCAEELKVVLNKNENKLKKLAKNVDSVISE